MNASWSDVAGFRGRARSLGLTQAGTVSRIDQGRGDTTRARRRRGRGWTAVAALILCAFSTAFATTPRTWVVESLADPASPGAGPLTLRQAINAAGAGDTIEFAPALFSGALPKTITLTSPLLVARNLTIIGPGDAPGTRTPQLQVRGNGSERILQIASPATAVVAGLGFQGGRAAAEGGGAVVIRSGATATFQGCDFSGNVATGSNSGGAILNQGVLTVDQCLVAGNQAAQGGGIASFGALQVVRSLIQGNTAAGFGGGIYVNGAPLSIESATISGNTGGTSGGIAFLSTGQPAKVATLNAVTVMDNRSDGQAGGLYVEGSGAVANVGGSIFARNVIVNKSGTQTPHDLSTQRSGKINSANYNLVVKPGSTLSPYGPNDQIGVDPQVGPLAYNGGRTRTYALGTGSPARDRGNPGFTGLLALTDQRGSPRAWSPAPPARADVGAFEFSASLTCDNRVTVPYAAPLTPATLSATLTLPRGGPVSVVWTVGGVAGSPVVVTLPDNSEPYPLSYSGMFPLGSTPVVVSATSGTLTLTCSTTVEVVDTTPPVIVTPANIVAEATSAAGAVVSFVATATDAVDGPVPVTGAPPSGSTFSLGTTLVTLSARDAAGNNALSSFTVTVRDTTAPVVSAPASVVAEATGPAGAIVTYPPATATDAVGVTALAYTQPSGTNFALGTTTVTVTARDAANNVGTASFTVTVLDRTPPVISAPTHITAEATGPDGAVVTFAATASDLVDGAVAVSAAPASGSTFPLGETTVVLTARDAAGNTATRTLSVTVRDTTPPVLTLPANQTLEATNAAGAIATFAATATDAVGVASLTYNRVSGAVFPLGVTPVVVTATDAAGNSASGTFTITVRDTTPPVIAAHPNLTVNATFAAGAIVTFAPTATDAVSPPTVTTSPVSGSTFGVGTTPVTITATDAAGNTAVRTFTVTVVDPYGITLNNVVWPHAIDLGPRLAPVGAKRVGSVQQMIARAGESRWYRFSGSPGSRIEVTLSELPANFDVVVYSDISQVYAQLLGLLGPNSSTADQRQALLGAEFAPEAYSPEAYSPEAYSPEAYSPEAYSPEAYSPEAYSPEAYSPEAYSPEAYSPEAYSPEAYSPEAYSPEAYSPEAYSPEAYASAQQRSLVAFSASPGTASEGVRFNTYSRSGEFYVRVRGQNGVFSQAAPYRLTVAIQQDLCAGVTNLNTTPATVPVITGAPASLLVWNRARISGTAAEKTALAAALASFAAAANGLVVDVDGDAQIRALNLQADANPTCPIAKNLVAEAIRNLIQLYRQVAPSIADVTLVGNDDVIPFFRTNDEALLASEANYVPPVRDPTQSQSSLRYAQVLTQDRYGSSRQISLGTGPYDLPEIPVGRLVETAAEVSSYLAAYTGLFNGTPSGGLLPTPRSAFVAGYDFLADSAQAMRTDFAAGLGSGGTVTALISPPELAPALSWTADQLRAGFLGARHDLAYLAAHFSNSRALAADYTTRFRAKEVADSPLDLKYAVVLSAGCHSGYNTVDGDAIPLLTEQPDWAQAFARKHAVWIAGTGYQYGDTDFIEYTERLLLEVARSLRLGSGPVSIGRAIVDAKRRYLAETPIMRGIHEKTLLQVTLYGLPMVKLNLPGARLSPPTPVSEVPTAVAVTAGPGAVHGLHRGGLSVTPVLTRVDRTLSLVGSTGTITASYFRGSDGIVSVPAEPVRPLESFQVNRPEGLVRGVGFRSGTYADLTGFVPFTGAPATETRGVHGGFATEVFYPVRPWNLNQTDEVGGVGGSSTFNVFPTQFLSDGAGSPAGTLRRFSQMQFDVFYCAVTSQAALANPPAINVVSSTVSGGSVAFAIEVAATAGAGVQEVWVTYTGLPGSPYYGTWQSLSLNPPANATRIGTWTGSLPLNGADAGPIRFVVQAVNGIGAVSANTNFGRFFQAGTSTLDNLGGTGVATTLTLVSPVPTGGAYRAPVVLQARLSAASGPLAGKRIQFRIGPVTKSALTDATGLAQATLVLATPPGDYALEASFAGDAASQNSAATAPFTVAKMTTALTFAPAATVPNGGSIVATLRATDGTPLKERTVIFILDNGAVRTAVTEITDGAGQARLAATLLAPATYQVTAYFGQAVNLPDGSVARLEDPLYVGTTASKTITVSAALVLSEEQAWVNYSDASAPGATSTNLGVSKAEIMGTLAGTAAGFGPASILASPGASVVTAYVSMQLSGRTIAVGAVPLKVQANDGKHWRGAMQFGGTRVDLNVDWANSGGTARYHVWVYPAAGSGPLYQATPALLNFQLILGTGAGEQPTGGATTIGGPTAPWTQQTGGSRVRSR